MGIWSFKNKRIKKNGLKNVVALINGLLKGYKLIYESEGENEK